MPLFIKKNALPWLGLSIIIIVLDQFTKYLANTYLDLNQPLPLLPFFNLTLRYNPGAAFSFLSGFGGGQVWLLTAIALIVAVLIFFWLARTPRTDWLNACALSLILGGALGNVIDRLRFSFVVDFFDFHVRDWHFATFNVADSAVCIGAFLLITKILFFDRRK